MNGDNGFDDVREALKKADPGVTYPPEKLTATKAEFVTLGKKMKKNKGCPFAILVMCFKIFTMVGITHLLG